MDFSYPFEIRISLSLGIGWNLDGFERNVFKAIFTSRVLSIFCLIFSSIKNSFLICFFFDSTRKLDHNSSWYLIGIAKFYNHFGFFFSFGDVLGRILYELYKIIKPFLGNVFFAGVLLSLNNRWMVNLITRNWTL